MKLTYTTKKGKTKILMGIPEKVTEKATLITFVLDINNLKRGKVEKWVANSLMTDLGDGNWEIPGPP